MFKYLTKRLFGSKGITQPVQLKNHIQKIRLFHGEILTHTDCDALVTFVTPDLTLGGALNKQVLEGAGPQLAEYIQDKIKAPKAGDVFAVPAFAMPYDAILLAILPKWETGLENEDRQMLRCYRNTIRAMKARGLRSGVFPALGFGKLNFPHIRFARLAVQGIMDQLDDSVTDIRIVCRDEDIAEIYTNYLQKHNWAPK